MTGSRSSPRPCIKPGLRRPWTGDPKGRKGFVEGWAEAFKWDKDILASVAGLPNAHGRAV